MSFIESLSAGHSIETNEHVAIKVIDKSRFSDQEEKIHREVDILHEIAHPGVIKLHAMFDTPSKVSVIKRIRGAPSTLGADSST